MMTIKGYVRENGSVGVRNHVLVLPIDDLSNSAAVGVAKLVRGTTAIPHHTVDYNSEGIWTFCFTFSRVREQTRT